ncbi:Uncharacterised protein [Candidatus Burarchaeum australiense]|nr:Uncharacterised protein [Candidatus Burarchaeum australiense]
MRPLAFALALLFLLPALNAVSLADFMKPYLLPGERYVSTYLTVDNSDYRLITISKKPTFLLAVHEDNFSIVQGNESIFGILRADALANLHMGETLDNAVFLLAEFNESRASGEAKCAQLTGTDRLPCIDKESCIVACRSVPNCEMALSYSIEPIFGIRDWVVARGQLDDAVLAAQEAGLRVGENNSAGSLNEALAQFGDVRAISANISSNIIFDCSPTGRCFCGKSSNDSALSLAFSELSALNQSLASLASLGETANSMAQRTAERVSLSNDADKYALVLRNAEEGALTARVSLDASLLYVHDDSLITDFNLLQGQLVQLRQSVGAKNYSQAAVRADSFFSQLNLVVDEAESNAATYRLLIDLQLNATNSLKLLADMDLQGRDAQDFNSLSVRLDAVNLAAPLDLASNPNFPTVALLQREMLSLASSSASLLIRAETSILNDELADLEAELKGLEGTASTYKQNKSVFDSGPVTDLMEQSEKKLAQQDISGARLALEDAKVKLSEEKVKLDARVGAIGNASQVLATASNAIHESEQVRFTLINPNLSEAKARLAEANALLYSAPEDSAVLSQQAADLAQAAVPEAQNLDQLAVIGSIAAGLVVLVAALYWIYKKEEA